MNEARRKKLWFCLLGGMLAAVSLAALRFGSVKIPERIFWKALFGETGAESEALILWKLRLPRMLGGILAGSGLALSGVLLQCITDNQMAGPSIVGVNAGAGFMVILTLSLFPMHHAWLPVAAFFGALGATALIIALAGRVGMTRNHVVLAGMSINALFSAGISFFSFLDSDVLSNYHGFSLGTLAGLNMEQLYLPGIMIALCAIIAVIAAPQLNLFAFGDAMASAMGVRVRLLRAAAMVLASASAAAAVSFAGLLGFVGLMAPHIARRLFGVDLRRLLPGSMLCGALLVVLADLLGRILFAPSELPAGILLALLGSPFFLMLLMRRKGRYA